MRLKTRFISTYSFLVAALIIITAFIFEIYNLKHSDSKVLSAITTLAMAERNEQTKVFITQAKQEILTALASYYSSYTDTYTFVVQGRESMARAVRDVTMVTVLMARPSAWHRSSSSGSCPSG
jgi:hypothetical protein